VEYKDTVHLNDHDQVNMWFYFERQEVSAELRKLLELDQSVSLLTRVD